MMLVAVLVMFIGAIVFTAIVVDVWENTPTNQRTTYHEYRYSSHRGRCRRRTRIRN